MYLLFLKTKKYIVLNNVYVVTYSLCIVIILFFFFCISIIIAILELPLERKSFYKGSSNGNSLLLLSGNILIMKKNFCYTWDSRLIVIFFQSSLGIILSLASSVAIEKSADGLL